jgi:SDR family mycofactocin-dependent oxidoreductase
LAGISGKVAFITGVARGQGRSHAVRLAEEGADIIGLDLCAQIDSVEYPMATQDDLAETQHLVEKTGRRMVSTVGDVRDFDQVRAAIEAGVGQFSRLDFVVANAGIMPTTGAPAREIQAWTDAVDVMLTGVFNTVQAAIPFLLRNGEGASVVIISSAAGLQGIAYDVDKLTPGGAGYVAAKHGAVGLMRNYAKGLGRHGIRVNSVHPMGVRTPMIVNEFFASVRETAPAGWMANAMDLDLVEPDDISSAVVWLCSENARYITGVTLPVDAGQLL